MKRAWLIVASLIIGLGVLYVALVGTPWPTRPGSMFMEWRLGERGWGYWSPVQWQDDCGQTLLMDLQRNLIVVGSADGVFRRQFKLKSAEFFSDSASPVIINDCRDRLFLLVSPGEKADCYIPAGSASELRRALRASSEQLTREMLRRLLPALKELEIATGSPCP